MDALNAAYDAARSYLITPVLAARYMLAKMRGCGEAVQPRLGGVYCLGNCSRTMYDVPISRHHFIIGDFFVDDRSNILFDESLTLKEDYDFTCSHLQKYGSVMRFVRMTVAARHYSNEGGACTIRDAQGVKERENIAVLQRKWPNALFDHGRRKNEVILRWKGCGGDDEDDETSSKPRTAGSAKKAAAAKQSLKKSLKLKVKAAKALKTKTPNFGGLPPAGVLVRTDKEAKSSYIEQRVSKVNGCTVEKVCSGALKVKNAGGKLATYHLSDAKYDLIRGYLKLKRGSRA